MPDDIAELFLEPAQIVDNSLDDEEEGWWIGKLGGKEGVFPSNYVEIYTTSCIVAKFWSQTTRTHA